MSKSYGCTCNLSIVHNEDGEYEIGGHVTDTDGVDIAVESAGKSFTDCYQQFCNEMVQAATAAETKEDEDILDQLLADDAALELELQELYDKVDEVHRKLDISSEKIMKQQEAMRRKDLDIQKQRNIFDNADVFDNLFSIFNI